MSNRILKFSFFIVVGIILSITLFLEFGNNNNSLLAQEQEKSLNHINNKNFQFGSNINDYTENSKNAKSVDRSNEARNLNNNDDDKSEMTIHIPKGSFHPATHRSFNPNDIIINKGESITWINEERTPHTVTSKEKSLFDSLLKQNEGFSYQFDKVGTFEFSCTLHPWMHGTINVI
jgi:plastocyanin